MSESQRTEHYDQPGDLMKRTIELVRERTPLKVYDETKISFYWLRKFAAGGFQNPSVNRVQYLYEHLTGKKLTV